MSLKNGYGNVSGLLKSLYVLGLPSPSNRNLIIQLPVKNDKRIFSISTSHNVITGTSLIGLLCARLIIIGGKFDGDTEEIFPDGNGQLPKGVEGANKYFDIVIGNNSTNQDALTLRGEGIQNLSYNVNFEQGLLIPDGQPASVILTYAMSNYQTGSADKYATIEDQFASLNVNGFLGGSDKIFSNVK